MNGTAMERAKQRALNQPVRLWKVAEGEYVSPSLSQPGWAWTLTVEGGDMRCNCPGAFYHPPCKHVAALTILRETGFELEGASQ